MYCPKCGTENPDDAQLCRSCSWVLTSTSTTPTAPDVKTSGLVIATLVLGILSFFTCGITVIPAIILGIVGLVRIGRSGGRITGRGFAVGGIIVALLMCVLAMLNIRKQVFRMWCGTNMSLLGMAMLVYSNDYDDKLPTPSKWCDLLVEHTDVTEKGLRCPGAPEGPCNYAMNKNVEKLGIRSPPDMVVLFETHPGWNQSGGPEILTTNNHQGEGCNVLFMDSHVEFVKTEDLDDLKWKPD